MKCTAIKAVDGEGDRPGILPQTSLVPLHLLHTGSRGGGDKGGGKAHRNRDNRGAGKQGGKAHHKGKTADNRYLCFAYNNQQEGCRSGQCGMVHACTTCEGPHPAFSQDCPGPGRYQ